MLPISLKLMTLLLLMFSFYVQVDCDRRWWIWCI